MRKKKTARTTKNKSVLHGEKIPADKAAAGFFVESFSGLWGKVKGYFRLVQRFAEHF
ncbi:hypothetical protein HOLDEFILI_04197 [Holdemania filiformis DSM 12042]|uniref:Uncharacterized protein n=1 Tax=Holdemania filiformis DSM 12042 TaxID=545696 RepID=B9YEC3_9FIRM|nr:hypothetical protein HOLDEFILI_04197 [Holdemania filiformis DSM 12042]